MLKQGKGLMEQIDISNKHAFFTGLEGMKMFHHAIAVQLAYERLELVKGISKKERENIKAMIGSPDHENLTVAQLLIEQYGQ